MTTQGTPPAAAEPLPVLDRAAWGVIGIAVGVLLGSLVAFAIRGDGSAAPFCVLLGAIGGALSFGVSPLRLRPAPVPEGPSIVPGEPVPLGSVARAFTDALAIPTAKCMQLAVVVALGAPLAVLGAYGLADEPPSLLVAGGVAVAAYLVAVACVTILPPFLLDERTRRAFAVLQWTGAREFERQFGSKRAVGRMPASPAECPAWLEENLQPDAIRSVDVEVMIWGGDLEAAREAVVKLPETTPSDRYVKAVHEALIRYTATGDTDRSAVRAALAAMPPGREQLEAATSSAVDEARLLLPEGDWLEPLVAARDQIPEGNVRILLRDHGWTPFTVAIVQRWPSLVSIVGLTVGLGLLRPFG